MPSVWKVHMIQNGKQNSLRHSSEQLFCLNFYLHNLVSHPSIHPSIHTSTHLEFHPSIYSPSIFPLSHSSVFPGSPISTHLFLHPPTCPSHSYIYLNTDSSIYISSSNQFTYPTFHRSIYSSMHPPTY